MVSKIATGVPKPGLLTEAGFHVFSRSIGEYIAISAWMGDRDASP